MTFNCGVLRGIVLSYMKLIDRQCRWFCCTFRRWAWNQVEKDDSGRARCTPVTLTGTQVIGNSSQSRTLWPLQPLTGSLTRWLPGQPESGRIDIIVRVELSIGDSALSPGASGSATVRLAGAALGCL